MNQLESTAIEIEEVEIRVPWGKLTGKWWGPKDIRPIVCLHGWLDNAGSFDTIIPLLPRHLSYLAIDFPGHGLSSRLPKGMQYEDHQYTLLMLYIQTEYKWEKISLMGHSMGAIITFCYTALYTENVDLIILLDALVPRMYYPKLVESLRTEMDNFFKYEEHNEHKSEPPSYTYDELIERLYNGSLYNSVDKDKCPILLTRAIKASTKQPDMFYFTRDNRLKNRYPFNFTEELVRKLVTSINVPHLYIKSTCLPFQTETPFYKEMYTFLKENKPKFETHTVEGTHHVHLNEPNKISDFLCDFINKYRGPGDTTNQL